MKGKTEEEELQVYREIGFKCLPRNQLSKLPENIRGPLRLIIKIVKIRLVSMADHFSPAMTSCAAKGMEETKSLGFR